MLQVKCIDKIKNNRGVITRYILKDQQGNQKIVLAEALKNAIRTNRIECINLKLTSDNRLIDINSKNQIKRKLTPVEMYKEYLNSPYLKKIRAFGIKPNAEYKVRGRDVVLTKVLVKNGIFVIPPFVTKLDRIKENDDIENEDSIVYNCYVFEDCENIKLINKSAITDMSRMFSFCHKLESLDLSEFDTSKATDMTYMFVFCDRLKKIDLKNIDTSKLTDMSSMFSDCTSLEELDLSSFDTSKVTNMREMFYNCSKLKRVDLSSFNTSNLTNTIAMFSCCKDLREINLGSFDTSNIKYMNAMFYKCEELNELKLSNFNTSSAEEMAYMFSNCKNLKELNLSSFDTSNVADMSLMFEDCINLETLDIHSFNILKTVWGEEPTRTARITRMFYGCRNLKNLDVTNFNIPKINNKLEIFENCEYKDTFKVSKELISELDN